MTFQMIKVHEGIDFKEINDHLNKKQYEMNQSDKTLTNAKGMIKPSF